MTNRYEVVFNKWRRRCWTPNVVRRVKTFVRAERLAQAFGDHHRDLWTTRALYHYPRSTVEIVDRKTGKTVWEHPAVLVPSVGELGYW